MPTFVVFACLFVCAIAANAQLTVRFVPFADNSQIDARGIYPRSRTQLTVTRGTTPVPVSKDQVFIVENNLMVLPDKVSSLPGNVTLVEWVSKRPPRRSEASTIYIVSEGETGVIAGAKNADDSTVIAIKDSTSRVLYHRIEFGQVSAGQTITFGLKIAATRSLKDALGNELNTRLDSVRTRTNNFTTQWIGAIIDKTPPPVDMVPAFDYRLNLIFKPTTDAPVVDLLSAYYSNGFREDILLLANPAPYPPAPMLRMISPNGGEKLAPCQKVIVRWQGMESGFTAFLELTTDNGRTWSDIDSTADSSYVWTVPASLSDSARIRVSQKLQSNFDRFAVGERVPTTTVSFSADGSRFAVGYTNRKIVEFSAVTAQIIGTYAVSDVAGNAMVASIAYVPGTSDLVAAIRTSAGAAAELQQFSQGVATPVARVSLPSNMRVSAIGTDAAGTTVFVVPHMGSRILTYAASTLDPTASIILNAPASATTMRRNRVTVMQLDGSIVTYDASTKQEAERTPTNFATDSYSVIDNIDISTTGFAALGGRASASNPTYMLDRATSMPRQVINRVGAITQVACAFSPTARYLGLGFMGQEQFELYNVESGLRLQSLTGSLGHNGLLSDLDYSQVGNAIVSSSLDSTNNVLLKKFTTPEDDQSDAVFGIIASQLATARIALPSVLIGRTLDTLVSGRICNTGVVPVVVSSGSFQGGQVFTLPDGIVTDTLLVGECLEVHIRALVSDTGRIVDTLLVVSCGTTFRIPFEMQGIDRSLAIVGDLHDFGDVCVGQRLLKKFTMLRNTGADSVRINNTQVVVPAQFRVMKAVFDTTVPPGGTLDIEVEFAPTRTGFDTASVVIRYADQNTVRRTWRVTGRGAGADVRVSHMALPFIPETPQRVITIHNSSDNAVTIVSGVITVGAPFSLLSTLPVVIGPRDSATLTVQYDGGGVTAPAALALRYEPCASSADIPLSLYRGSAQFSIPSVSADPRTNTTITVLADMLEDVPYSGSRRLEGAFAVDPQLFLAQEILSTVGAATLISQDIVNNERIVRFSVEGSFGDTNEIARLIGPAGLGRADSSFLTLDTSSTWFGASVSNTFAHGVLRIVNPNPGRKILDQASLLITAVQPSPATDHINVHVQSKQVTSATIRVVHANGVLVLGNTSITASPHASMHTLNVSALTPGVYTVVLTTDDATAVASFIVVR